MVMDAAERRKSRGAVVASSTPPLLTQNFVAIITRMEGSTGQPHPSCLAEDALAAFAEGQIAPRAREAIEAHLADCHDCRIVLVRAAGVQPPVEESHGDAGPDALERDLVSGTRVGRYVVERRIGRGGMGTVYAADDPDLGRRVAVKILRADMLPDAACAHLRARLLREAQAMARLSHPEVITVHDVGTFGDQLFVAMEYVEGETLRQWRASRHRSYAEVLAVYERAGSGLAAAHEAGLVHRDFKPDNVLVGHDGRVRVTDFGLARSASKEDADGRPNGESLGEPDTDNGLATTLTQPGTLVGTPAYMPPEQLRGRAADACSDVFSFCVALYESLYDERPFHGGTVPALLQAIEHGPVRAPPITTRVPRWLRAVLLRGLRAKPAERFASMRELLDALRAAHAASRRRLTRAAGAGAVTLVAAFAVLAPATSRRDAAAATPLELANAMTPAASTTLTLGSLPAQFAIPATLPVPVASRPSPTSAGRRDPRRPAKGAPPARGAADPGASKVPMVGNNGAIILE